MNTAKLVFPALSLLVCMPSPAFATAALGPDLQALTVFADTYASTGANSSVFGNVWTGDVGTAGAGAYIAGSFTSVGAGTIGGIGASRVARIDNDFTAGGVLTTGDSAQVGGNMLAGGAATVGANSLITGNVTADGAVSTGAISHVFGNIASGGAASIGATAVVDGSVAAVGAITRAADSHTGPEIALAVSPVDAAALTSALTMHTNSASQQLLAAQSAFANMATTTTLAATMTTDTTLFGGVYSAASLSTTAGTTLTLDAQGLANQFWVFNIADILATGASTRIVLLNGARSDSIIWNAGGYASLGASSTFLGTLIANQYISVGANTQVGYTGSSCGGLFSALSYVSTGDSSTVGGRDCSGISKGFEIGDQDTAFYAGGTGPLPEPTTWVLLVSGLGWVGSTMRRRRVQVAA